MDANQLWILIGKKLSDEASPEELLELDSLMKQGLGDIYPLHVLEELWKTYPATPPLHFNRAINQKWQRFEEKLSDFEAGQTCENKTSKWRKVWKFNVAATVLALCLFTGTGLFWFWDNNKADDNRIAEITAPATGISKILLPDGTKVWLNAGSKLIYKNHFGEKYRKVTLIGEAFFDVVKDASHPFIVTTSSFQLKVLGTAFNVRSYPNDKTSEAALVRGKIEVSLNNSPDKKFILRPSEKLTIKNFTGLSNKSLKKLRVVNEETPLITLSNIYQSVTDSLPSEALWMESKLAFDAENFEEISQKMQRWYKVNITFKNEELKDLRFSGEFKNESLYQALSALQQISPFQFSIHNNQVIIY